MSLDVGLALGFGVNWSSSESRIMISCVIGTTRFAFVGGSRFKSFPFGSPAPEKNLSKVLDWGGSFRFFVGAMMIVECIAFGDLLVRGCELKTVVHEVL